MRQRPLLGFLGTLMLLIPIAAAAAVSDQQFRDCMRDAMNNRENRIIDVSRNYYNDRIIAFEDRRNRLNDSWNIDNDRDRGNEQRNIDRDATNRLRDLDRINRDDLRNIRNDFRNDERRCRDELNNRDRERRLVPVGRRCFHSDECRPPTGICTIEFGQCNLTCEPGSSPCVQVCAGTCVVR